MMYLPSPYQGLTNSLPSPTTVGVGRGVIGGWRGVEKVKMSNGYMAQHAASPWRRGYYWGMVVVYRETQHAASLQSGLGGTGWICPSVETQRAASPCRFWNDGCLPGDAARCVSTIGLFGTVRFGVYWETRHAASLRRGKEKRPAAVSLRGVGGGPRTCRGGV